MDYCHTQHSPVCLILVGSVLLIRRLLLVNGLPGLKADSWLTEGLKALRACRKADGTWRRFRFFYTLLALTEIGGRAAREEKRFAAPACERYLANGRNDAVHALRRRRIAELILLQT